MASKADFLVDARWLNEHRGDANLVIVDTRAAKDFWAGHLAGARHFDPFPFHYSDSSERGTSEFKAQLRWIFSALGITTRHVVVFYENDSGMRATRGAWALEWMGHRNAKILDGGLKALASEKLVTEVKPFAPVRVRRRLRIDDASASLELHRESDREPRGADLRRAQRRGVLQRARAREAWRRDSRRYPSRLDREPERSGRVQIAG